MATTLIMRLPSGVESSIFCTEFSTFAVPGRSDRVGVNDLVSEEEAGSGTPSRIFYPAWDPTGRIEFTVVRREEA